MVACRHVAVLTCMALARHGRSRCHLSLTALAHLPSRAGCQEKIAAELDARGLLHRRRQGNEPAPREIEHADLRELPYLNNVIKESMRLYPVAIGTLRWGGKSSSRQT